MCGKKGRKAEPCPSNLKSSIYCFGRSISRLSLLHPSFPTCFSSLDNLTKAFVLHSFHELSFWEHFLLSLSPRSIYQKNGKTGLRTNSVREQASNNAYCSEDFDMHKLQRDMPHEEGLLQSSARRNTKVPTSRVVVLDYNMTRSTVEQLPRKLRRQNLSFSRIRAAFSDAPRLLSGLVWSLHGKLQILAFL